MSSSSSDSLSDSLSSAWLPFRLLRLQQPRYQLCLLALSAQARLLQHLTQLRDFVLKQLLLRRHRREALRRFLRGARARPLADPSFCRVRRAIPELLKL